MDEKGKEAKEEGAHEACKLEAKGSFFLIVDGPYLWSKQ
jgi:hypothetical protein